MGVKSKAPRIQVGWSTELLLWRSEPVSMDEKWRVDVATIKETMKEIKEIKEMFLEMKKIGNKFKGGKNSVKEEEEKKEANAINIQ